MKKWLSLAFLILLLPFASAMLVIDGPSKETYGVGENIDSTITITPDHHTFGMLKLLISCTQEVQVFSKVINLDKDKTETINQQLSAPPNYQGTCKVKAILSESGQQDMNAESKEFTISSELNGNFTYGKSKVQLGKLITINGNIYRLNGEEVNGIATLYLKLANTTAIAKSVNVDKGVFVYSENSAGFIPGDYEVQITVNDVKGSSHIFNLETLSIVDDIIVTIALDNLQILPGDDASVSGTATAAANDEISDAKVQIVFGGVEYDTKLSGGKFSMKFKIPTDFKSGDENVYVTIEDEFGNRGENFAVANIIPIPTELNFTVEGEFAPGQTIKIKPYLHDQAGADISKPMKIEIISSKGDVVFEKELSTGEEAEYSLLTSAPKGKWKVKATGDGLEATRTYNIEDFITLNYRIEGYNLIVENFGNAKYKGGLEIAYSKDGKDTNIVKQVSIGSGEALNIDLAVGMESGTYDINVGDKSFTGVSIIGKTQSAINWEYLAYGIVGLAILVIFMLIINSLRKHHKTKKKDKSAPWDEEKARQRILEDLKTTHKKEKRPMSGFRPGERKEEFVFGSHDPETIFGSKRKKQRHQEQSSSWGSNDYQPPKNDDKKDGGGLFNMFG